jgi:hypothetical protein
MKARALNLTNREMRSLRDEINRQTAQNVRKLSKNLNALVLWQVRKHFGVGKKKLLEFQDDFLPSMRELQEYYMTSSADETDYICEYLLKTELGIDVKSLDDIISFNIKIDQ